MGDYYNHVKLGSCGHMMYITREEALELIDKEDIESYSDFATSLRGFTYRFPRKDDIATSLEDINNREPFDYLKLNLYGRMENDKEFSICHNKSSQVIVQTIGKLENNYINSITYNLPFCIADHSWYKANGKGSGPISHPGVDIYIVGNAYNTENPEGYTIIECPFCGCWSTLDDNDVKYIKNALLAKGMSYEATFVKAKA